MKRWLYVLGIIALFAVTAFISLEYLTADGETACPEGKELTRQNPPNRTPRFYCR